MVLRAINQSIMEHNQYGHQSSYASNTGQWMDSAAQYNTQNDFADGDYGGFRNRTTSYPQESTFGGSNVYSPYVPRQPSMFPTPLPSMLISQLPYQSSPMSIGPQQPKILQSHSLDQSHTYSSASAPSPQPLPHRPTPRRTLTDADRRRMCLYKRDNPSKKQTEIGGKFPHVFNLTRTRLTQTTQPSSA